MSDAAPLEDRLLDAIRTASGDEAASWARRPRRLVGGSWADTFWIRLNGAPGLEHDLVARVLPEPDSFDREMLIQSYVASQGFSAPRVHLGYPPGAELDRAWFLMDYDPGRTPIEQVTRRTAFKLVFKESHEIPPLLADTMVAIHAIDAAPVASALSYPRVVGPVLDWLFSRASALGDGALVERAHRLLATRPAFAKSVLCHGDLHPLNILRSPGRDTVIDWTHAQYDDPLYDVAFTFVALSAVPIPAPALARPLVAAAGKNLAHRFLVQYERASQTEVDRARLAWFEQVIKLRIYLEAAEWRRAHPDGDPGNNAAIKYVAVFDRHAR